MLEYPSARDAEFGRLVALADPGAHALVCDLSARGCYLRRYLAADAHIVAVETSPALIRICPRAPNVSRVLCTGLSRVPLANGSFPRVLCLAGLHSAAHKMPIYQEVHRILTPGGVFCFADVSEGSGPAAFLNVFVHAHSSSGYAGIFFNEHVQRELEVTGFSVRQAALLGCPWRFPTLEDMARFCKLLFGIDRASEAEVLAALKRYVGVHQSAGEYELNWEQLYVKAVKA